MNELIQGARINSKVVVHDNYIYRRNSSTKCRTAYLICIKKSCPARANKKSEDSDFCITRNHNHKANRAEVEELLFKASCKRRAIESALDLRSIFNEECARYPEGSRRITFSSFGGTLQKLRTGNRLCTPQSPEELNTMLEMNTLYTLTCDEDEGSRQQFFRGMLQESEGNGTAVVIFASETMTRDVLRNAKNIYMTLTSRHSHLPDIFTQLLTIHAETMNYVFPCVYAMMTHNTEAAYNLVFEFVKAFLCPEMNPVNIITDFDPTIQSCVSLSFPNATHSGHIYTYANAIWQHIYKNGLSTLAQKHLPTKKVIQFLIALPLLPPTHLLDGLEYIKKYAEEGLAVQRSMSRLFEMVQVKWLEAFGQKMSVCDKPERTNNFVDGYLVSLTQYLGKHNQNIWKYMEGLQQMELFERQNYQLLSDNPAMDGIIEKSKPNITLEFEAIKNAISRIQSGSGNLKEFFANTVTTASEHLCKAAQDVLKERDATDGLMDEDAQEDPTEGEAQDDSMSYCIESSSSPTHFDHAYGANPGPSKVEVTHIFPTEQVLFINEEDMLVERPTLDDPVESETPGVSTGIPSQPKMFKFVQTVAHVPQAPSPQTSKYVPTLASLSPCGSVNMKCVCCKVRNKTILFLPCRHLCCCPACADAIDKVQLNRKCPICQVRYLQTISVIL